jgi:hypothetical protein
LEKIEEKQPKTTGRAFLHSLRVASTHHGIPRHCIESKTAVELLLAAMMWPPIAARRTTSFTIIKIDFGEFREIVEIEIVAIHWKTTGNNSIGIVKWRQINQSNAAFLPWVMRVQVVSMYLDMQIQLSTAVAALNSNGMPLIFHNSYRALILY